MSCVGIEGETSEVELPPRANRFPDGDGETVSPD
jgi:hypothetical protein